MRWTLPMLLALALGCGGSETDDADETEPSAGDETAGPEIGDDTGAESSEGATEPEPTATGVCQSADDCAEGEMCTGPEGCDEPWTCQPMRPCTRDLVVYCSCEGETVRGSGSCPPEPYAHRGPC
jgi:hypothetical protein